MADDIKLSNYAKTAGYGKYRKTKAIAIDYTVNLEDDLLVMAAVDNDIDITLPLRSSLTSGMYQILELIPVVKNGHRVRVKTQGSDTFPFGNTWFDLPKSQKQFEIGMGAHGFNLRRNISVYGKYVRAAEWLSSEFSSVTPIPFDSEEKNNQSEIIQWSSSTHPERIYVKTAGEYKINYSIIYDSTGGATWNSEADIYKNGTLVPHTQTRGGNYGSEDDSVNINSDYISLDVDDYIDIRVKQTSLTGKIVEVVLNIEIRL